MERRKPAERIKGVITIWKRFILFPLLLLLLSGCATLYMTFEGESESWKGDYTTNIDGDWEDGTFSFFYKEGDATTQLSDLHVRIVGSGTSEIQEDLHQGPLIQIKSSCGGCKVTEENDIFEVMIKWDGEEETMRLRRK